MSGSWHALGILAFAPRRKKIMNAQIDQSCPPRNADVRRGLETSGYGELRTITCRVEGGIVTLNGRVSSYYLKQIAQSIVGRQAGVCRIENLLDVR